MLLLYNKLNIIYWVVTGKAGKTKLYEIMDCFIKFGLFFKNVIGAVNNIRKWGAVKGVES